MVHAQLAVAVADPSWVKLTVPELRLAVPLTSEPVRLILPPGGVPSSSSVPFDLRIASAIITVAPMPTVIPESSLATGLSLALATVIVTVAVLLLAPPESVTWY